MRIIIIPIISSILFLGGCASIYEDYERVGDKMVLQRKIVTRGTQHTIVEDNRVDTDNRQDLKLFDIVGNKNGK